MKILLTGEPRTGKSTLLSRLLQHIPNEQGFVTKEISHDGQREGFELVSSDGLRVPLANVAFDSKTRVSRYGVNIDSLNKFIDDLPQVKPESVLYIDEIGQMQLFSDRFQNLVVKYIQAKNNFIGTISKVCDHDLITQLKNNPEIEIIEVTLENRDQLFERILATLKQATQS